MIISFSKNIYSLRRGFSLIELLVVIAIIALLSSVVLATVRAASAKARDARRLEDIKQIQTAFEMYYIDTGFYPAAFAGPGSEYCGSIAFPPNQDWLPERYIKSVPRDPLFTTAEGDVLPHTYLYCNYPINPLIGYNPDLKTYALMAALERTPGNILGTT